MSNVIRLRRATIDDARRLYDWRNEAETRMASFNTTPLSYEDHLKWLQRKLSDPNVRFLIAGDDQRAELGYARLDLLGKSAEINLSLGKEHRGQGIGTALIRTATGFAIDDLKVRRVIARIKPGNAKSALAFRRAGFRETGTQPAAAGNWVEMVYDVEGQDGTQFPGGS